jgi:hypothetical protein
MSTRPPDRSRSADDDLPRDARLSQALQHMPDAHMAPSAQVRAEVLRQARLATEGSLSRSSPLRRWLRAQGSQLGSGHWRPAAALGLFLVGALSWTALNHRGAGEGAEATQVADATPARAAHGQAQPLEERVAAAPRDVPTEAPKAEQAAKSVAAGANAVVSQPTAQAAVAAPPAPPVHDTALAKAAAATSATPPVLPEASVADRAATETPVALAAATARGGLAPTAPAAAPATLMRAEQGLAPAVLQLKVNGQMRTLPLRAAPAADLLAALRQAMDTGANAGLGQVQTSAVLWTVAGPAGEAWEAHAGLLRYRQGPTAPWREHPLTRAQAAALNTLVQQAVGP